MSVMSDLRKENIHEACLKIRRKKHTFSWAFSSFGLFVLSFFFPFSLVSFSPPLLVFSCAHHQRVFLLREIERVPSHTSNTKWKSSQDTFSSHKGLVVSNLANNPDDIGRNNLMSFLLNLIYFHFIFKLFMCHQMAQEREKKEKAKQASRQSSVSARCLTVVTKTSSILN